VCAPQVSLNTGAGKTGSQCGSWTISHEDSGYLFGDDRSATDKFEACCACGGGKDVGVGFLRDYGEAYGDHGGNIPFGWNCAHKSYAGAERTARAEGDGHLDWMVPGIETCEVGQKNEFNIAVPYDGTYLVTYYVTRRKGGTGEQDTAGVAIENVRFYGYDLFNGHGDGYINDVGFTGVMEVPVFDGNLTLSMSSPSNQYWHWIQVEMVPGLSEVQHTSGADR